MTTTDDNTNQQLALIGELIRENERLRMILRSRTVVPQPQQYMSGRWHRRDGDIYGITVQPPGVADADSPPGYLRPTDQR